MTVRVKQCCSFDAGNMPVVLRAGQLFADDHPWVQSRGALFEPVDDAAITGRAADPVAVETATAAPAERRQVTRGRKGIGDA